MNDKHTRIKRLETAAGGGPCDLCGYGQPGPVRVIVYAPEVGEDVGRTEYCSKCGRPTKIVLHWPEDDVPGGLRDLDATREGLGGDDDE
jgi:hypothetical protein